MSFRDKFLEILKFMENSLIQKFPMEENVLSTSSFNATYLEELDLAYNQIENIENLDALGPCLQKLNLMGNKIKKLSGLDNLAALIELNLSKNNINRLKGLQGLTNLRYLYLSSNKISHCNQVAYLTDLPFLTELDFCFNDVQNKKFYRFQILYYIPELRKLDGQEVTHFEKVHADILFGADLENKKEIFKAYLPEEEFVDRRLFLSEQIDPESDSEDENIQKGYINGRYGAIPFIKDVDLWLEDMAD